jgi:DNA-binding LacI/PurR family transcriptional regulator
MVNSAGSRRSRTGVRDVAALAGVSTQTVSRVLNNSPNIRPATRDRVLAAIAELDYRPNNAARSLGSSTTRTLGVIATDSNLYGPSTALTELATAARESGRWMATAYADAADDASLESAVDHLLGQGVDGIVLVAPHTRTRDTLIGLRLGLPLAIMHDGPIDRQAEATALVMDHLVSLGHRRIGRLGGPADWLEEASRLAGFKRALAGAGLWPSAMWEGDWSAQSAAERVDSVIAHLDEITAVIVANDQMALGLMAALQSNGVRIPADVSIAGFDDNPDSGYYLPALTTVRLDIRGEAQRCVATVFGSADPPEPAAPTLVVRGSTAPPRSS